jgi:preprotein translocase subunit SecF
MDFAGKRRWFFLISIVVITAGLISMAIPPRFRIGVEFTGGSALSVTFAEPVEQGQLRSKLSGLDHGEAVIQRLGDNSFLIRTDTLEEASIDASGNVVGDSERNRIEESLAEIAPLQTVEVSEVSALVAGETVRNAIIAILIAATMILIYITWAFRLVPNSFRMGSTAILAAIHDVLVVVGIFSIVGKFINAEINAMFITGILTVVGYSVHDTIVVFDRIRENTMRRVSRDLETTINISIMETLGRSLTTSLTTVFVILALLSIGGGTILSLLLALLVGIITGTYSSIGIASQLLITWEQGGIRGLFRREPSEGSLATSKQE